jgi:bacterioferritin-associated ferredoxin
VDEPSLCPLCERPSQVVKRITVNHFVDSNGNQEVSGDEYYICLNKDCDIVYFSADKKTLFFKADMNMPIWFKTDANPKYICYCSHVTEQQIIDAVKNSGAKNIKDIVKLTGAMKNCNCELNHPLGKCCGPVIQETIDKALKIK